MNVVSYARVSTLRQESEMSSLVNQERAFAQWIERGGHRRLRAYREAASAKNMDGRVEFQRMIADLADLRPDAIIVDTLDRWTRDATDGLVMMRELRGHGVGLLPLDWRRDRPIDLDDDRDWQDLYDEFGAAERERRRIRRRVIRSYEGRRERGATTHNRVPIGVRRDGDRLVPSEDAWLVHELDRRILAGEKLQAALRAVAVLSPKAWQNERAVYPFMRNEAYVAAGVRSREDHEALAAIAEEYRQRYGTQKTRVNMAEFTGVFVCPQCGNRMYSSIRKTSMLEVVHCQRMLLHKDVLRVTFTIDDDIRAQWFSLVDWSEDAIEEWVRADTTDTEKRRGLERQIALLDQRAAYLKKRRDKAFDLLVDGDASVEAQARTLLREANADEQNLELQRTIVSAELSELRDPVRRNADDLRAALRAFRELYNDACKRTRNEMNRTLCAIVGSHPTIARGRKRTDKTIVWNALRVIV